MVPAGLPADLLERRPDVASAERQLAAANARIGVAKAAFFPVFRLTASGGYVSGDLESLLNWDSRVWSVGPSLSLPLFAGGRNEANLSRARSAYEEAVAKYRQQVLVAFAEVQENLTGLRILAEQGAVAERGAAAATEAARLSRVRYDAGIVGYLDVVEAERTALNVGRESARIQGQRRIATVQLVKALGGGWSGFSPLDTRLDSARK